MSVKLNLIHPFLKIGRTWRPEDSRLLASPSGTDFLFDKWVVKNSKDKGSLELNERNVPGNLTNVLFDRHMEWLAFRERALPPSQIPSLQDGIFETEAKITDDVQPVFDSIVEVQLNLAKQVKLKW